ncbi:MAG: TetR family transcriptional regulator C-terminal domain-containing protein [Longimicrobiales bacterium]
MTKRTRTRAPDETRQKILFTAFEEIHLHGFRASSLDAIAARAGVTKGALYHHFPKKAALGHAVVEEVIREPLLAAYLEPLRQALRSDADDPIRAIQDALRRRADDFEAGGVELGCPLNNLAQELSPLDEAFRARVATVLEAWIDEFAGGLTRAQARGFLRPEVDAHRVASFMVAAIEGAFGVAKNAMSVELLRSNLETLADFLDTLRVAAG